MAHDQASLDMAISRFPWRLRLIRAERDQVQVAILILHLVPDVFDEYRRIMEREYKPCQGLTELSR
jgi:hypothetical protein